MDIVRFLFSINKVTLVALFGTAVILIYEIKQLRKESKEKAKPNIPKFNQSAKINPELGKNVSAYAKDVKKNNSISHKVLIWVLVVMVLVFGAITLISGIDSGGILNTPVNDVGNQNIVIQEVKSNGLKILNSNFKQLGSAELNSIRPGDSIILGVEGIADADIDTARIRINSDNWMQSDIITHYNKEKNLYYREYQVATGEQKLKIQAQLHSKTDGWLGE